MRHLFFKSHVLYGHMDLNRQGFMAYQVILKNHLTREEEGNKRFILSHFVNPRTSTLKILCVLQMSKSAYMFLEEIITNANMR